MTDDILAAIRARYSPYDKLPEFQEGYDAWQDLLYGCGSNPYDDGVKAQAWDRGANAAREYNRALDAARRGAVVETMRRPTKGRR